MQETPLTNKQKEAAASKRKKSEHVFGYMKNNTSGGNVYCPTDKPIVGITFGMDENSRIHNVHKIHCMGDTDVLVDWSTYSPVSKKTLKCQKGKALKSAKVNAKDGSLSSIGLVCSNFPNYSRAGNRQMYVGDKTVSDIDREHSGRYQPDDAKTYIHGLFGSDKDGELRALGFYGKSFSQKPSENQMAECLTNNTNIFNSPQCANYCKGIMNDSETCQEHLLRYCEDDDNQWAICERINTTDAKKAFCKRYKNNSLCDDNDNATTTKKDDDDTNYSLIITISVLVVILVLGMMASAMMF